MPVKSSGELDPKESLLFKFRDKLPCEMNFHDPASPPTILKLHGSISVNLIFLTLKFLEPNRIVHFRQVFKQLGC